MPSKTPDNFQVSPELRLWSENKYGFSNLPDVFLSRFKNNWLDRIEDGRAPKWKDPELALRRWVREASPSGGMYKANEWEAALQQCKAAQRKESIKVPLPDIKVKPKWDRKIGMKAVEEMKRRLHSDYRTNV